MLNRIINLKVKKSGSGGGLLYVSVKTGDASYDCLSVATVNEDCYNKLVKLQGDYESNKE